jgi:hypothetical protein
MADVRLGILRKCQNNDISQSHLYPTWSGGSESTATPMLTPPYTSAQLPNWLPTSGQFANFRTGGVAKGLSSLPYVSS